MDMDFALFRQVADNLCDERNVSARFYDKAVKTDAVSANGLPVFKNVTYIEIRLKDNSTEVFNQPASKEKIKRFPKEYALYCLARKQTAKGTPLEQFAFLSAAEIATCKSRGIFTVETLAELSEDKVQSLDLKHEHEMAVIFLRNSKDNCELASLARREEKYRAEIANLKDENKALKQTIEKLSKSKKLRNKGAKNNENDN